MTGERRDVAIAGWFGSQNVGDELLLHALLETLKEADPNLRITVLAANPERVTAQHGVPSIGLPVRARGLQGIIDIHRVLGGSRLLILGPGTVFQERSDVLSWPGTLPMLTRLVLHARVRRVRVAILGAGIREGGTPLGAAALKLIGLCASQIAVRDSESASGFGGRARVVGDMAMAIEYPLVRPGSSRFLVSMRPLTPSRELPLARTLQQAAASLTARGMNGVFLPMAAGDGAVGENDLDVYDSYFAPQLESSRDHLRDDSFQRSFDRLCRVLGQAGLVLATRLHAALPAVLSGVPTVAFAYERKIAETFRQLGLEAFVLRTDATLEEVIARCDLALSESGVDLFRAARKIAARQREALRAEVVRLARM